MHNNLVEGERIHVKRDVIIKNAGQPVDIDKLYIFNKTYNT
jgi:hypothetical protein